MGSSGAEPPELVAVVDLGSTAVRLLVARVTPDSGYRVLAEDRRVEIAFPVLDPHLQTQVREILEIQGGDWLIGTVRALPPEQGGAMPAAALTGFTGPEHRASILRAGFQYHVKKPVSLEKLAGSSRSSR